MRRYWACLVLIPTLLEAAPSTSNRTYYVFTDDRGQTRIEDSIPPDYKQRGYRIVNEQGMTLEVVQPSRTSASANSRESMQSRSLTMRDKALLQTFGSVDDLAAARDKHLTAMDGITDITRFNQDQFAKNLQAIRQSMRQIEASGEAVPEKMHADIIEIQRRIDENQAYIERKTREKETVRARYARDIARFTELIGAQPGSTGGN